MSALMTMAVVAGGLAAVWCLARAALEWRRFGGTRVVTCPETGRPAAVRIDSAHAAMTALVPSGEDLRLAACSRWETRGRCEDACLEEALGPRSRASEIASTWFAGRRCVYCGKAVREEPLAAHHPALLGPDGISTEWPGVAPEQLPDAFGAGRPVCWDCHVAETFRRRFPELVTDRPART